MPGGGDVAEYAGLPVAEFGVERRPSAEALADPSSYAWFVRTAFAEEPFEELWQRFLKTVDTSGIKALRIGYWGVPDDDPYAGGLLAEAASAFPALRSLFLGDIDQEELEISWIEHGDLTQVLKAFPDLELLEVRGSAEIVLEAFEHTALRKLRFESGGLPANVVRAVGTSVLPNLRHLDLWLGSPGYGGDTTAEDLAPLLSGERLPALRHLGIEDAEIQDQVAAAVAGSAIVAQLESLSLAMGTLADAGAEALLSGQPLGHLKRLDLHHHFLTDAMMARVRADLPDVEVLLDGQEAPSRGFVFIAVAE